MNIIRFPTSEDVDRAIADKEPLLLLKAGFSDRDIDKYFRLVLDEDGAE